MQYTRVLPNDVLANGTLVRIESSNKCGHVASSKIVPASNGGMITVHTILITHKMVSVCGHNFKLEKLVTSETWEGNYSFIIVDDRWTKYPGYE